MRTEQGTNAKIKNAHLHIPDESFPSLKCSPYPLAPAQSIGLIFFVLLESNAGLFCFVCSRFDTDVSTSLLSAPKLSSDQKLIVECIEDDGGVLAHLSVAIFS
jgi:hypothetical protein